jgi:hypothetical protein
LRKGLEFNRAARGQWIVLCNPCLIVSVHQGCSQEVLIPCLSS